jgi:carbon storage regulator
LILAPVPVTGVSLHARRCAILVLSRQPGESIVINDDVTVTVVEVKGDRVKLGFDAPRWIEIWRKEIWVEKQQERESA